MARTLSEIGLSLQAVSTYFARKEQIILTKVRPHGCSERRKGPYGYP